MVYSGGGEIKIQTQGRRERVSIMEFYAMDARDLLTVEKMAFSANALNEMTARCTISSRYTRQNQYLQGRSRHQTIEICPSRHLLLSAQG